MKIVAYRPINRGDFRGFFDVEIPAWHMQIKSLKLFQKNGHKWISMPSEKISKVGEEDKYYAYVKFSEKEINDRFVSSCLKALDEYFIEKHSE